MTIHHGRALIYIFTIHTYYSESLKLLIAYKLPRNFRIRAEIATRCVFHEPLPCIASKQFIPLHID